MKGIILAAGKGTRLYPASMPVSKNLLPIYDKPMIYYPLATLMNAGIRDILIVVSKSERAYYKKLLKDGKQFGISIKYAIQKEQKGITDAFLTAERFINNDSVALVLGDNIFCGEGMYELLAQAMGEFVGACVFCKKEDNPADTVTAEVDSEGKITTLGSRSTSALSVAGLYFFDGEACRYAKKLAERKNGFGMEDLLKAYLDKGELKAQVLESDAIWASSNSFDSLHQASDYIYNLEKNSRKVVSCPEEVALRMGYITKKQLADWVAESPDNSYFDYVRSLVKEDS